MNGQVNGNIHHCMMRAALFVSIGRFVILLLATGLSLRPTATFAAVPVPAFPEVKDLPLRAGMPDPLIAADGTVSTPAQWQSRREEMKRIIEHYAIGHAPPAPGNVTGYERESAVLADGRVSYRRVRLSFGPEAKLGFDISIFAPVETSERKAPFPTIVQPSFVPISELSSQSRADAAGARNTPGTLRSVPPEKAVSQYMEALGRGYVVVTFFYQDCGTDQRDYRTSGFFPAYPEHDWADLAAWAWGMSRCVDYLEHQAFADKSKLIAMGHSRLGKAVLVAGAFDERFALVAPAGSGCGGTGAYRFNGKGRGGREGLEDMVRNFPQWTSPRLAEFSGQVEKLPFDQHWFMALVAPRLFIAADGLDDGATSVNALVQSYQAAKPVYALLGVPDHLGIHFRPGKHMLGAEDWAAILDFSDQHLRKAKVNRRFDQLPR